ncbi:MAG TPA: helix-turn-helix domain-containing protein [Jatrophihabitans sp.]|jgi:AcrR family transcriptional regulator|nr:helix-turn-helix domain-containing protein [Jatrophihabitans sp.]
MPFTPTTRARLTQPERVEAMRNRLLDATIESLAATGYSGFSTNDVVRRAGVSRGALAHHFPVKADLIAAAGQRLIALRAAEFRQRFDGIPPARRTVAKALNVLWSFFDDPSFHALMELTIAARSDPELRTVMAAESKQVADTTLEVFGEAFPELAEQPFIAETLQAILALYTGLALQQAVDADADGRHAAVRRMLKGLLTMAAAGAAE